MNAQKTLTSIGFVGIWLASQAVCAQSITDGLVRHYRFDEASGAVAAIDSTGVSDLTQSAEAFAFPIPSSGQVGQIGGAWDFERDNGELLDEGDAIFGGTLNISVSAWLKPESFNPVGSANYTIFSEDSGSVANKDGWLQVSDAGAISWQIEGVGLLTSPAAVVPNGGWSHVAAVRDAGLSSLYVNGAEVATLAVPATITRSDRRLRRLRRVGWLARRRGVLGAGVAPGRSGCDLRDGVGRRRPHAGGRPRSA